MKLAIILILTKHLEKLYKTIFPWYGFSFLFLLNHLIIIWNSLLPTLSLIACWGGEQVNLENILKKKKQILFDSKVSVSLLIQTNELLTGWQTLTLFSLFAYKKKNCKGTVSWWMVESWRSYHTTNSSSSLKRRKSHAPWIVRVCSGDLEVFHYCFLLVWRNHIQAEMYLLFKTDAWVTNIPYSELWFLTLFIRCFLTIMQDCVSKLQHYLEVCINKCSNTKSPFPTEAIFSLLCS